MDKFINKRKRKLDEAADLDDTSSGVLKKKAEARKNNDSKDDLDFFSVSVASHNISWKEIRRENLCCDYVQLFTKQQADAVYRACEQEVVWNTGKTAQVQLFGKWIDIPRKQSAYGDSGLSYHFSGNSVPARPWCPFMARLKDYISHLTGESFNFVLVNRYKDGEDYMGFHKDDEKDLDTKSSIASLSFGQSRDFVFKHEDNKKKSGSKSIDDVSLTLEHGSLLMMKHPTNRFWYHALPKRKRVLGVRINLTFRKMVKK